MPTGIGLGIDLCGDLPYAKAYADAQDAINLTAAKAYADAQDVVTLSIVNAYFDSETNTVYMPGIAGDSQVYNYKRFINRTVKLPIGLVGSVIIAGIAAHASYTITLYKNAGPIGTLIWSPGTTAPTITFPNAVFFFSGDIFKAIGATIADTTLGNLEMTLLWDVI